MAKENKMLKGMLIGAAIGAAVTLFDRKTRENVTSNVKKCGKKTWHSVKHPKETIQKVSSTLTAIGEQLQYTAEETMYILDKISELTDVKDKVEQKENDSSY